VAGLAELIAACDEMSSTTPKPEGVDRG
jgi:hypothetical protein